MKGFRSLILYKSNYTHTHTTIFSLAWPAILRSTRRNVNIMPSSPRTSTGRPLMGFTGPSSCLSYLCSSSPHGSIQGMLLSFPHFWFYRQRTLTCYPRTCEALADSRPGTKHYRHKMQRCLLICSGYFVVSIIAVVMEVYALLALQFCDGEDLMSLYWSTWTMLQVGSLIAILGIILAAFNAVRGNKNP